MYIPDLTERFPEGFGGVDLTDSYFPCMRGGLDLLSYMEIADYMMDHEEIPYEGEEDPKVEKGV